MGGLWAVDDPTALRGQHPEEAQGSYEPVPEWVKRVNILSENLLLNKHKIKVFAFYMCIKKWLFHRYLYFPCTKRQPWVTEEAMLL